MCHENLLKIGFLAVLKVLPDGAMPPLAEVFELDYTLGHSNTGEASQRELRRKSRQRETTHLQ